MIKLLIKNNSEEGINLSDLTIINLQKQLEYFQNHVNHYIKNPLVLNFSNINLSSRRQSLLLKFTEEFLNDLILIFNSETAIIPTLLSRVIYENKENVQQEVPEKFLQFDNLIIGLRLLPIWKFLTNKSKEIIEEIL